MSIQIYRARRASVLGGVAVLALLGAGSAARAQTEISRAQNQPAQTTAPQACTGSRTTPPPAPAAQPPAPAVAASATSRRPRAGGKTRQSSSNQRDGGERKAGAAAGCAPQPAPAIAARVIDGPLQCRRRTAHATEQQLRSGAQQSASRRSARRPTRSATRPSSRCRKAPISRSRKCCCRRPACRRIPRRAARFHIRNDHANAQVRINGIMMPDGVTGF